MEETLVANQGLPVIETTKMRLHKLVLPPPERVGRP